jgi:tol-pal system protein YbgF
MNRIANATIALCLAVGSLALVVPLPVVAQGGYAVEQRFQEMERLITQLTGQVERLQNQLQQLQQQLERQQSDYDYRIQQLEGARGGSRPPAAPPRHIPPPRGDIAPGGPTVQGGLSPGQQTDMRPLGTTPSSGPPPSVAAAPPPGAGGTPELLYNEALAAMRNGDYAGAERGFRDFVARYARHQLAGNAQYWLGETYYVRKDFPAAATAYANGFRNYRASSVGPDNLLKLGMSLQASGKSGDACTVYGQFNQVYPQASEALKRRVSAERQRSRCG